MGVLSVHCRITSHLGVNPIRGGIPNRDRKAIMNMRLRAGARLDLLLKLFMREVFIFNRR